MAYEVRPSDVLLVVDIQNDFCPGGALPVSHGDEVIPVVNALMRRFSHVVLTQDWHPPGHVSFASSYTGKAPYDVIELSYGPQVLWPDHCVPGTEGARFHAELDTTRAQAVVRKGYHPGVDSYSAFVENDQRTPTGLLGYFHERGLRRVFLTGLAEDYCVHWSALDGRKNGLEVVVIEDGTRAIDLEGSLAKARAAMAAAGVERCRAEDIRIPGELGEPG